MQLTESVDLDTDLSVGDRIDITVRDDSGKTFEVSLTKRKDGTPTDDSHFSASVFERTGYGQGSKPVRPLRLLEKDRRFYTGRKWVCATSFTVVKA